MIDETEFVSTEELKLDLSKTEDKVRYDLCNFLIQYKYTSITRSQLSDYELLLLFYNGLSEMGEKFKPLIEEYALLKNLPRMDIYDSSLFDLYEGSAYKNKNEGKSCA